MTAPWRANSSASESGTPRRSVMTAIGNGDANADIRSNCLAATT